MFLLGRQAKIAKFEHPLWSLSCPVNIITEDDYLLAGIREVLIVAGKYFYQARHLLDEMISLGLETLILTPQTTMGKFRSTLHRTVYNYIRREKRRESLNLKLSPKTKSLETKLLFLLDLVYNEQDLEHLIMLKIVNMLSQGFGLGEIRAKLTLSRLEMDKYLEQIRLDIKEAKE